MANTYILVEWPESQIFMEEEWFEDEAILNEQSSYFIPEKRFINNEYILEKSEELALQFISTIKEDGRIFFEWEKIVPFRGGMTTFESVLNLKLMLNK
jgi:hypothetical protein